MSAIAGSQRVLIPFQSGDTLKTFAREKASKGPDYMEIIIASSSMAHCDRPPVKLEEPMTFVFYDMEAPELEKTIWDNSMLAISDAAIELYRRFVKEQGDSPSGVPCSLTIKARVCKMDGTPLPFENLGLFPFQVYPPSPCDHFDCPEFAELDVFVRDSGLLA